MNPAYDTPNRRPVSTLRQLPVWVVVVIAVCCLVEMALQVAPLVGYPSIRAFAMIVGGFWSQLLWTGPGAYTGQPYLMFVTYGLLHSGILHLAMNMLSLAVLARELNKMIGAIPMAVIYAVSQIAAASVFAEMAPTAGPMVGASGAIFGLAGALLGYAVIVGYRRQRAMGQLWRSVVTLLVLNIALTVAMPSIAWQAHLGGAVAGLIMGAALAFMPQGKRRR